MCGICGIAGFEDKKLVKEMAGLITHRGPDDDGFYFDKNIGLASRRLSIIDISSGKQPIFNEDKSIAIVFNVEIYNYSKNNCPQQIFYLLDRFYSCQRLAAARV